MGQLHFSKISRPSSVSERVFEIIPVRPRSGVISDYDSDPMAVVIGRGPTPVKILFRLRLQKICLSENFFKYILYRKIFKKIISILYYMNSLSNEDCKKNKEEYNYESDTKCFWNEKEIQNYICLEDQLDYCFRKNITI